jgi:hypothetical protein
MSEGNFKEKEKLVTGPKWAPDTRTDWPMTVGRKLTSTSIPYENSCGPNTTPYPLCSYEGSRQTI